KLTGNDNRNDILFCALENEKNEFYPAPILAYGFLEGKIAHKISVSNGFGYDPIVILPQLENTLAEISDTDKNKISHR
ncbi:non-canonical purine NTP pyrophosphatase, partial [Francisella tularensis subsp. holarctica]|uniref:non-canonical purine NTP pyrophosphatase n=1 Tax=Francisella tularensis TaxID=263 RepID=UPI002381C9BC